MFLEKYAVVAGFFAALASVFSKLSFEDNASTIVSVICLNGITSTCEKVVLITRAVCLVMVIFSNIAMWFMFTKSLQTHSTSVQPTVINGACNFVFSSMFGWLLFGESLSLKWWVGFSLIVTGFILMTDNHVHKKNE